MALLKCPECGGNISSTTEKCIHCGYEFKVCPECQTVVDSNARFCSECGAQINAAAPAYEASVNEPVQTYSDEKPDKTERPEFPPLEDLLRNIKKPAGYYVFKTFHVICYVFAIIALVIFFLSMIIGLATMTSVYDLSRLISILSNLFVCSIWFGLADVWMNIANLFRISGIRKWSAKNNIDLADVIKSGMNDFSGDRSDRDKNLALFAYAYRTEATSQSPVKPIILSVLKLINSFASILMYLPILYLNIGVLVNSPLDLSQYIGMPFLVVAITVSIGFGIAIRIVKSNIRKGMNKHIQNIVPSKYDFNYD